MLHVRFAETNGALIVTPLVSRLDAGTAPEFRATVTPAVAGRRLVVVSLSHVRAVDASGLAALVAVLQGMAPGGELRIAHADARVRALLASTRLDELFPSFEDATSALLA
ncbi:MAG TPA: STAS domain-containing protein [Anaeromyxobacter sp.]|nr:STAS domain-containing protein [Anaeromyxobacter sp.]